MHRGEESILHFPEFHIRIAAREESDHALFHPARMPEVPPKKDPLAMHSESSSIEPRTSSDQFPLLRSWLKTLQTPDSAICQSVFGGKLTTAQRPPQESSAAPVSWLLSRRTEVVDYEAKADKNADDHAKEVPHNPQFSRTHGRILPGES